MIWYTLEKNDNNIWTVWKNVDSYTKDVSGSLYFCGLFSGTKKECLEYCKTNKIKILKK